MATEREIDVEALAGEIAQRIDNLLTHDTPSVRAVRREYSRRLAHAPARDVVRLGLTLLRHARVHRFVADELIANHREALETLTTDDLEQLGHGIGTWDQVDCFALYLAGPAWRERQVPDEVIHTWARSPNR
jgi:hypothetical protein